MQTILVIDDDELVSRTLQRALKLYDYQVMVANSGAEGLQLARRHRRRHKVRLSRPRVRPRRNLHPGSGPEPRAARRPGAMLSGGREVSLDMDLDG